MKKLLLVIGGLALLAMPLSVFAGVQGSKHDRTGSGENLCNACHVPHNAQGEKLWARTVGGPFTGVQNLCYTCHDGSVTTKGATTAFDAAKEQHKNVNSADCSGGGACHDVHNQGAGDFLVAGVVKGPNGDFCTTCHDGSAPAMFTSADALGDHTYGGANTNNHMQQVGFSCNQCHTPHGATAQTAQIDVLTNPILLADNNSTYYGDFCISCHNGTPPAQAVGGTGGVAATDMFNYAMSINDGTEDKHPTISTTGATPVGGCNKCHDVHDAAAGATPPKYLLTQDNTNSAYCFSCHSVAGAPPVGGQTHPHSVLVSDNAMNAGSPLLPWAQQIDEDGNPGADWPSASVDNVVCESCHSVHKNGLGSASNSGYFLRNANGTLNELCSRCHSDN